MHQLNFNILRIPYFGGRLYLSLLNFKMFSKVKVWFLIFMVFVAVSFCYWEYKQIHPVLSDTTYEL
ncbi:hypothetical protein HanXRQr2_Chr09g0365941 [Helianthus annuus]|nr:hypothetical protein HanXRQr2_Chr09g0365941 [Helianthus annuus]KAJ0532216.1 hypothetical protein HanIR_Chr09g0394241 [Helianthus annuus]KAJ0891346.1 hypothetical protein HanPSC8_Chr09g0352631 [Helianthus annuus]